VDFEEYVAARGQALLRFAYVLTTDAHAAEDLVQSALADAYRHWRKVSRADHPDAYVRRIIVNIHLRWRKRRSAGEIPAGLDLSGTASAGDHADGVVAHEEFRRVLDGLPARSRTVLVLRYYADLDDATIADLMGIGASSVRSAATRALAALRETKAATPADKEGTR
jgi:RNA polymerase sigma-70 factor (sigma-E family)